MSRLVVVANRTPSPGPAAGGLAVALACLYPRGRWMFVLLAVSAGGQRVVSGDHFASDVVWGAGLGCFCAIGVFNGGLLAPWFDRLERRGIRRR